MKLLCLKSSKNLHLHLQLQPTHRTMPPPKNLFEMHDHHPGVKYSLNGEEKWTPVKKRRCKKRNQLNVTVTNSSFDDDSSSSSSELDVSCSRLVQYSEHDGTPGLSIHRRNIVWTPIAPNPIASRTRSRTKSLVTS